MATETKDKTQWLASEFRIKRRWKKFCKLILWSLDRFEKPHIISSSTDNDEFKTNSTVQRFYPLRYPQRFLSIGRDDGRSVRLAMNDAGCKEWFSTLNYLSGTRKDVIITPETEFRPGSPNPHRVPGRLPPGATSIREFIKQSAPTHPKSNILWPPPCFYRYN